MQLGRWPIIVLGSGLTVLVLGIVFGQIAFPKILQKKIKSQIRLEDGGDLFKRWQNITIPIFMKVYIFSIRNPDEFAKGEKPELDELGPYIYQQHREKVVEGIHVENDTVQYRPKITYYFRPDMSNGREDDVINIINVPLVSVVASGTVKGPFVRSMILSFLEDLQDEETLFIKKTVSELLFEGYHEPLVAELSALTGEELMPDNRFGIYYSKNGTAQDFLEIFSGVVENEKFGNTISWKGNHELDFWGSEYCNKINGSDGSIFPPFLTRDRVVRIFSPDMCRSIYMTYSEDVELKGIPAYRFTTPKDVLGDPREYPENLCYCTNPQNEDLIGCTKSGVFRLAPCRKGAPIVASWPHFFDGDKEYQEQSIGLSPEMDKHETFISLEPNTGALLQASKRFQINLEVKPNKHFKMLKEVPHMLLPILWVDESVSLTEDNAKMIQGKLIRPMKIGEMVMFSLLGLGSALLLFSFLLIFIARNKSGKS